MLFTGADSGSTLPWVWELMAGHAGTVAFELVTRVRSLAGNTPETAEAQSKHQPHEVAAVPGTVHLVSAKRPRDEHRSRSLTGQGSPALALAMQRCPPFYHSCQVIQSQVSCQVSMPTPHLSDMWGALSLTLPGLASLCFLSQLCWNNSIWVYKCIYILYACMSAKSLQSCPTR